MQFWLISCLLPKIKNQQISNQNAIEIHVWHLSQDASEFSKNIAYAYGNQIFLDLQKDV